MTHYPWLTEQTPFPHPDEADDMGILALGGDLSVERLIDAYSRGIFPWFDETQPIIWWSVDPRFVLLPNELHVSRSMRQILDRNIFQISYDRSFREVITHCSTRPRKGQNGTWITTEMLDAYTKLHHEGYAHSVEAWRENNLVGGLYGVSLGGAFFGESMFSLESNASKAAFITLVRDIASKGFTLIDSQVHTAHLDSLGAREIPRTEYLSRLENSLSHPTIRGNWGMIYNRV